MCDRVGASDKEMAPREDFCYGGWIFLGRVVELPDGDEEIVHEPVPCRRCTRGDR